LLYSRFRRWPRDLELIEAPNESESVYGKPLSVLKSNESLELESPWSSWSLWGLELYFEAGSLKYEASILGSRGEVEKREKTGDEYVPLR
jgi:hypothetical protein